MCGIAGAAWSEESSAVDAHRLERMAAVLHHRGPDDHDIYVDRYAGLAHARLSIIDLATGRQPLSNEDGTIWIAFNGEIYNFAELRSRLVGCGHTFRTATDTEAIVHLYEQDGLDCFKKLRGMFALAIWDARRKRLVLARDRMGKKPLVYTMQGDRLAFASEIKALLELPGVPRDIDPLAIDQYLSVGYVPHPRTIYRDVFKLPPAHYAVYEQGHLRLERYWSLDDVQEDPLTEAEYCERLRYELLEATRIRMVSDVPLGAFLSGGVDSTIIVGLMQKLAQRPTKTFSISFSVKEYDESQFARQAAAHLGTEHHEFLVEDNCLGVLPDLIWHFDEPFADSSAIPTFYLAKMTKQAVTVALTGDGGDEVFCGYERYRKLRDLCRCDVVPAAVRRRAASAADTRWLPRGKVDSIWQRGRTYLDLFARTPVDRYARIANVVFQGRSRGDLYADDFARELRGHDSLDFVRAAYREFRGRDNVTRATLADELTYLPCDILAKVDIASMAYGLECRSPLLDQNVVELAARMPLGLRLRGNVGKYILKKAFADVAPPEIVARRKMGFGVPLKRWFRKELSTYVREVLLDAKTLQRGYFRPAAVEELIREHVDGVRDHSVKMWALLCFELWHHRFVDAQHAEALPA